jgi:hypothetical protein
MRAHLFAVAIAGMTLAAAVSAEPPKPSVHDAGQQSDQAPVLVAAADTLHSAVADDQQQQQAQPQPTADKPVRHARVTTCRCGGQNPGN